MIPATESIVVTYLRGEPDVAALVGERIATRHQDSTEQPWVKVTQLADPVVAPDSTDHLIEVHLQLDCYGGASQPAAYDEASELYRHVRAALHRMPETDFDEAVVSCVEFGAGGGHIPDDGFEPARERFTLDCFVYIHDKPGGS